MNVSLLKYIVVKTPAVKAFIFWTWADPWGRCGRIELRSRTHVPGR